MISDNKDLTFKPTIFDKSIFMFQNEYRQQNKRSFFITDFNITDGYKSKKEGKKNMSASDFLKGNKLKVGTILNGL